jgi:hypothetical protein
MSLSFFPTILAKTQKRVTTQFMIFLLGLYSFWIRINNQLFLGRQTEFLDPYKITSKPDVQMWADISPRTQKCLHETPGSGHERLVFHYFTA